MCKTGLQQCIGFIDNAPNYEQKVAEQKVAWLKKHVIIKEHNSIAEIAEAGADMFVAGSAIFGSEDYQATIQRMRAELDKS